MWRWRTLFGGAFLVLFAIAHVARVHGFLIEPSPDGYSLGEITAEDIRVVGLIFASVPLILLAIIVWLSTRIRQMTMHRPAYVGVALLVAILMLGYTLRVIHG